MSVEQSPVTSTILVPSKKSTDPINSKIKPNPVIHKFEMNLMINQTLIKICECIAACTKN